MISSIVNIVKARPRSGFFFVALALLVTAPRASCAAGAAVLLEPGFSMAGIRGGYEILEDRGGLLRIGDVATPAMSDSFVMAENFFSVKDSVFSACWIRFAVRNGSSADTEWYLELASPLLEQIDVYRVNVRGEVSDSRHAGRNDRFGYREIDYRNFVFRFIDSPHEASTLYIRARSGGSMIFPVSIWSPEKFHSSISREYVFLGIFCGAIW
jgi:hypothetical protein